MNCSMDRSRMLEFNRFQPVAGVAVRPHKRRPGTYALNYAVMICKPA